MNATQISNYSELIIFAAKEQGFNTFKEIEENFEPLLLYVLSLEQDFLKKILLQANDKKTMEQLALYFYQKLK